MDTTSTVDRWGDYTGICRRYNATPPAVWMAGMYGNSSHYWTQWIAKIGVPATISTGLYENTANMSNAVVYPNPIIDNYHINFTVPERQKIVINITDMQGRIVKELYNDMVEEGENMFSFNKANLTTGMYSLNIIGATTNLKNEKIIIADK